MRRRHIRGLRAGLIDNECWPPRHFDMRCVRPGLSTVIACGDDHRLRQFPRQLTQHAMSIDRKPRKQRDCADDAEPARDSMPMA